MSDTIEENVVVPEVKKHKEPNDYTGKLPEGIVKRIAEDSQEFLKKLKEVEDYDLQVPHLVELSWEEPFFGSLSRRILKTKTIDIPTAGVRIVDGLIEMLYNPIFFKFELQNVSPLYPKGVIKHELYHVIFEHVTTRRQEPHPLWNAATDCAINSLIPRNELPSFCLMPGELYVPPDAGPDWKPSLIAKLIKKFPPLESSEYYMQQLLNDPEVKAAMERAKQKCEAAGDGEGAGNDEGGPGGKGQGQFDKELSKELYGGGGGQIDDHSGWDELSDAERDMWRDYIRDVFRDCVREAESHQSGWGNVPESVRQHLKKLVSKDIDWRELLSQFIGRSRSTSTSSSIKRMSRRAPWEFPGRKRTYSARPAVPFDQSGSMQDSWVELLFAELSNLGNLAEYDMIPFDHDVDTKNIQTVRKGQKPNVIRTRMGGTSFDAPIEYVNDNCERYDATIMLTDGGCSAPMKCNTPLAYILAPGCELMFTPPEGVTVIRMTDTRKK